MKTHEKVMSLQKQVCLLKMSVWFKKYNTSVSHNYARIQTFLSYFCVNKQDSLKVFILKAYLHSNGNLTLKHEVDT